MLVPVLFLGPKAGVRSFVFPYERCPRAETKGGDIHVCRQHEHMRSRFNPFGRPLPLCHRTSLRVSIAEYGNKSLTVSDWVESYSAPNWKPRLNVMRPSEATAEDSEIISSSREAKVG